LILNNAYKPPDCLKEMVNVRLIPVVLLMLALAVIFSTLVSASTTLLLCINEGEVIEFSQCNNGISDRTCTSDIGCKFCVKEISPGVFCPANFNECNAANLQCTELSDTGQGNNQEDNNDDDNSESNPLSTGGILDVGIIIDNSENENNETTNEDNNETTEDDNNEEVNDDDNSQNQTQEDENNEDTQESNDNSDSNEESAGSNVISNFFRSLTQKEETSDASAPEDTEESVIADETTDEKSDGKPIILSIMLASTITEAGVAFFLMNKLQTIKNRKPKKISKKSEIH